VSLPGGKSEEGDKDEKATAIREAKEEIGLQPDLVSVVTVLEPIFTKVLPFNSLVFRLANSQFIKKQNHKSFNIIAFHNS
jgi:8-oxo-dGTP pyrophosphatase MutT (NUDIX family)